jgi:sugar-specific transcriptional regulator TrmB
MKRTDEEWYTWFLEHVDAYCEDVCPSHFPEAAEAIQQETEREVRVEIVAKLRQRADSPMAKKYLQETRFTEALLAEVLNDLADDIEKGGCDEV